MESIKGYARRTTQSIRERISGISTTPEEQQLLEAEGKIMRLESSSRAIADKLIKIARLVEEIGVTMKEIGEVYGQVPDLVEDSQRVCQDVLAVGAKLTATAREQQGQLNEAGFKLINEFSKNCVKLEEAEKLRQQHHLECEFFKRKVHQLRTTPQKDFSRLPRNEQRLNTWKVEVWRSSEICRSLTSELYIQGRRAIDSSVLSVATMLQNFFAVAASETSATFHSLHLPQYQAEPVLPPLPAPQQEASPPSLSAPPGTSSVAQSAPWASTSSADRRDWSQPPASQAPPWSRSSASPPATSPQGASYFSTLGNAAATVPTYQPPPASAWGSSSSTTGTYSTYQPPPI